MPAEVQPNRPEQDGTGRYELAVSPADPSASHMCCSSPDGVVQPSGSLTVPLRDRDHAGRRCRIATSRSCRRVSNRSAAVPNTRPIVLDQISAQRAPNRLDGALVTSVLRLRAEGHSSSISEVWRLTGLHSAPATSIQEPWSEGRGLSPPAWPACGAPSPPARERPTIALLGVAYPDHTGWSGCGNPQHGPAGDGRRQRLKLHAS